MWQVGNWKLALATLAILVTFTTAFAGIKYDIPMMDISKEAGPNGTRLWSKRVRYAKTSLAELS